jgi:hypothetical protein
VPVSFLGDARQTITLMMNGAQTFVISYTDDQDAESIPIGVRLMAQRTHVLYVDDIDGSEAEGTVRFGFGGTDYEIDLSKGHADQFTKAIGPFIAAARKAPASRRSARGGRTSRHDLSNVRKWAREQGIKISDRGRIPADVLARYQAAH